MDYGALAQQFGGQESESEGLDQLAQQFGGQPTESPNFDQLASQFGGKEVMSNDPSPAETWGEMRSREIKTYAPSMFQYEAMDLPILRNIRDYTVALGRHQDEGLKSIEEGGKLNTIGGVVQYLWSPFAAASEALVGNPAGEIATQLGADKGTATTVRDVTSATAEVFAPVGAVKTAAIKGVDAVRRSAKVMTVEEAVLGEAKAYQMAQSAGAAAAPTVGSAMGRYAQKVVGGAESVMRSNALTNAMWEVGAKAKSEMAYRAKKARGIGLGEGVMRVTGGRSISTLRNLDKKINSPALRELTDMMEHAQDSVGRTLGRLDFHERVNIRTAEHMSEFHKSLEAFKDKKWFTALRGGEIGKSTKTKIAQMLRGTSSTVRTEAERAIGGVRDVMENTRLYHNRTVDELLPKLTREQRSKYYIKPLMRTGADGRQHRADYYPRMYDKTTRGLGTRQGREEFEEIVQTSFNERYPELKDEMWDYGHRVVESIMNGEINFVDDLAEMQHLGNVRGIEIAPRLQRTLSFIPDEKLEKFLIDDPFEVIPKYIDSVVKRAEWMRTFGVNGEKVKSVIKSVQDDAKRVGYHIQPHEISDIEDIAMAMQHNYKPWVSTPWKAMNNGLHTYQYIRTLPLATLSSLSEVFIPFFKAKPSTAIKGVAATFGSVFKNGVRIAYKGVNESAATKAAKEFAIGWDMGIADALAARSSGSATKGLASFFKLTGLTGWTRGTMVGGFHTGKEMVNGHAKFLADNYKVHEVVAKMKAMKSGTQATSKGYTKTASDSDRLGTYLSELQELGIDPLDAYKWAKTGGSRGLTDQKINEAGVRFVSEVVVQPRAAVRPLWHSNPHYKLLSQLKGFATVFGNTVVKKTAMEMAKGGVGQSYRSWRQMTRAATAGSLIISTALATNALREWYKYDRLGTKNPFEDEEPIETFARAVDRSGLTGIGQVGMDTLYAHRFQGASIAQPFGPAITQGNEVINAFGEGRESMFNEDYNRTSRRAQATANAIPIVNVIPEAREKVKEWVSGD